jgi:hypothetical protein
MPCLSPVYPMRSEWALTHSPYQYPIPSRTLGNCKATSHLFEIFGGCTVNHGQRHVRFRHNLGLCPVSACKGKFWCSCGVR